MKPSVILYAVFLTVSLGIKAQQADTVSYEVTKIGWCVVTTDNMPEITLHKTVT